MRFAEPNWLWIGAVSLAALGLLILRSERLRARALARFVAARHLSALTQTVSKPRRFIKHALTLLGVACLFCALARPQWGYHFEQDKREGTDVLFAVDTSKSMLAEDLRPNRLTRAKLAVEDLLGKLPGARVGLVAFAGDAFLQTPLTQDRVAFQKSLDALDTQVIEAPGTNLQSAIRVAKQAFGSEPEQRKVLVLLTDGEDLANSVGRAARSAADSGIVVYALGVGTSAGSTVPAPARPGALLRGPSGELVHSQLDEAALRELTRATGGSYYALGTSGQGIEALYHSALAQLPKQLHAVHMRKVFHERFQWPLGLGMLLLFLERAMQDRRRRSSAPARTAALTAAAAALLSWPLTAATPAAAQDHDPSQVRTYNSATGNYRKGDFAQAEQGYREALGTRDLPLQERAYYDLGNSLYRQGQATEQQDVAKTMERYKQAVSAYESALALSPKDADAQYNRDFVRAKLKQLEQHQNQQQQQQQQQNQQQQNQSARNDQGGDKDQQPKQGHGGQSASAKPQSGQGSQANADQQGQSQDQNPQQSGAQAQAGASQAGKPGPADQPDQARGQGQGEQDQQSQQAAQQPNSAEGQKSERADARQPGEPANAGEREHAAQAGAEQAPGQASGRAAAAAAAATKAGEQPGQAAVPGGLTGEQAQRLLNAMEGELKQLPSSYAAQRATATRDDQAQKDW